MDEQIRQEIQQALGTLCRAIMRAVLSLEYHEEYPHHQDEDELLRDGNVLSESVDRLARRLAELYPGAGTAAPEPIDDFPTTSEQLRYLHGRYVSFTRILRNANPYITQVAMLLSISDATRHVAATVLDHIRSVRNQRTQLAPEQQISDASRASSDAIHVHNPVHQEGVIACRGVGIVPTSQSQAGCFSSHHPGDLGAIGHNHLLTPASLQQNFVPLIIFLSLCFVLSWVPPQIRQWLIRLFLALAIMILAMLRKRLQFRTSRALPGPRRDGNGGDPSGGSTSSGDGVGTLSPGSAARSSASVGSGHRRDPQAFDSHTRQNLTLAAGRVDTYPQSVLKGIDMRTKDFPCPYDNASLHCIASRLPENSAIVEFLANAGHGGMEDNDRCRAFLAEKRSRFGRDECAVHMLDLGTMAAEATPEEMRMAAPSEGSHIASPLSARLLAVGLMRLMPLVRGKHLFVVSSCDVCQASLCAQVPRILTECCSISYLFSILDLSPLPLGPRQETRTSIVFVPGSCPSELESAVRIHNTLLETGVENRLVAGPAHATQQAFLGVRQPRLFHISANTSWDDSSCMLHVNGSDIAIRAHDLVQMNLRGTELVVLCASIPSKFISTIASVFLAAGAQSVLLCNGTLPADVCVADFMIAFYVSLLQMQRGSAAALAQSMALHHASSPWCLQFVLYGACGVISLAGPMKESDLARDTRILGVGVASDHGAQADWKPASLFASSSRGELEKKWLALLIGCDYSSDYIRSPRLPEYRALPSIHGDIDRVRRALLQVQQGCDISVVSNATAAEISEALQRLADSIDDPSNTIVFIYFTGHGSEGHLISQDLMLLPIDDVCGGFGSTRKEFSLSRKWSMLQVVVLMDCCRCPISESTPVIVSQRGSYRGIRRRRAQPSFYLMHACGYLSKAIEQSEAGLFTTAVLEALAHPGLNLIQLFGTVKDKVIGRSMGRQRPHFEMNGDQAATLIVHPHQESIYYVTLGKGTGRLEARAFTLRFICSRTNASTVRDTIAERLVNFQSGLGDVVQVASRLRLKVCGVELNYEEAIPTKTHLEVELAEKHWQDIVQDLHDEEQLKEHIREMAERELAGTRLRWGDQLEFSEMAVVIRDLLPAAKAAAEPEQEPTAVARQAGKNEEEKEPWAAVIEEVEHMEPAARVDPSEAAAHANALWASFIADGRFEVGGAAIDSHGDSQAEEGVEDAIVKLSLNRMTKALLDALEHGLALRACRR